jgi:hypothetical protein
MKTEGRIFDRKFSERIKADLVIALAVTHHLLLTQHYSLNFIFKKINELANKYVIIEFMPLGLYGGDLNKIPKVPEYYNVEWFKNRFSLHFILIEEKIIELNRHVFIGKKKLL